MDALPNDRSAKAPPTGPMPAAGWGEVVGAVLIAGVAADVAWEIWARIIAVYWIGGPLEPEALVRAVFGVEAAPALGIHALTGVVGYPAAYVLVARPLWRRLLPALPWWLVAILYGAGLWVFALYAMAHLAAGMAPFLGFAPIAWASLVGHLIYALVLAGLVEQRLGDDA